MSKRNSSSQPASTFKKVCPYFKPAWLLQLVKTKIPTSRELDHVKLDYIFEFNEEESTIKCKFCTEAKVDGDFSIGKKWDDWKLDYLKRHLNHKTHIEAVEILTARRCGGLVRLITETPKDREVRIENAGRQKANPKMVRVLIDNVILAIKLNTSMNSVQEINSHVSKYVQIPESWRSKNYAFEFVECINQVIQNEDFDAIRKSQYHCLIIDESTDISVHKMLIIYIKFRTNFDYKTSFATIIQLSACDALSIVAAIKKFYSDFKLDMDKMVMMTSDGAAVMLGGYNGVAKILQRDIPYLSAQHCVAHREDLGIDDAWRGIPLMKTLETLLRTVYTMFSRSSVKKGKFQDLAAVMECDVLSFRPLNEVRWLSRHFAVIPFIRNYDVLIEYCKGELENSNDPISKYCVKALTNSLNRLALTVLNDILTELAKMSKFFQKSVLSPMEAHQYVKSIIKKIRSQYLGETIFWSEEAMKLLNTSDNTAEIIEFITKLCDHLDFRFPEEEMKDWAAFDHVGIANSNNFNFGNQNLLNLLNKYSKIIPCYSEEVKRKILSQYSNFKFLYQTKFNSNVVSSFADMVDLANKEEEFQELSSLIDISATFQASSADCERGFSQMNAIKTKARNRLETFHLDHLMRIKLFLRRGNEIDVQKVFNFWKNNKDRRGN